jgi:hypothetical protein
MSPDLFFSACCYLSTVASYTVTPMPPSPAAVTTTVVDDNPAVYEHRHVHAVYDQIAPHFSSTRYKVVKFSSLFVVTLNGNSLGPLFRSFY